MKIKQPIETLKSRDSIYIYTIHDYFRRTASLIFTMYHLMHCTLSGVSKGNENFAVSNRLYMRSIYNDKFKGH